MKKIGLLVLALAILSACNKEKTDPQVELKVNISGFSVSADDFGALKSTGGTVFDDFMHVFAPGKLYLKTEDGTEFTFSSGENSLDGASITLAPGKYTIYGASFEHPTPMGSKHMLYEIPGQDVYIYHDTKTLDLEVEPTCALVLVADSYASLSKAYLQKYFHNEMWNLYAKGIFYYSYFLPDEDYYLNLVRKDENEFTLPTKDLKYGYVYKIEVHEPTQQTVELHPYFEDGETIVW